MKRILTILLLSVSAFATTTVTGNIGTLGTGTINNGAFVRFWLRGCSGNQPRITGASVIGPSQGGVYYFDFVANGSGAVSGTLYSTRDAAGTGNGDIECGGSYTAVWYGMQIFVAGKGGPEVAVHAKKTVTLDISSVTPITTNPVIVAPTGDSTYLRLDAGNSPVTGLTTFSAGEVTKSLNNVQFADQFTGADASAKIMAAVGALPAAGGTVDARNLTDSGGTGSTVIDVGSTKAVTILLGATTYNLSQIVLRPNLRVLGAGMSSLGYSFIQATGGNTTPVFVLPQASNAAAVGVELGYLYVQATAANTTQEGMLLDCSGFTNSGLWYSYIHDMVFNGFIGNVVHFKGRPSDAASANQFQYWRNVQFKRTSGSGQSLYMEGYNAQLSFEGGEFDGAAAGSGTNIYLGTTGSVGPLSIHFKNATIQGGLVGVQIDGAAEVDFDGTHCEATSGVFKLTFGSTGGTSQDSGIDIHNTYFGSACGVNSSAGYLLNVATSLAHVGFHDNFYSSPDNVITSTNLASVTAWNNQSNGSTQGVTTNVSAGVTVAATISTASSKTAWLSSSATPITTINSTLLAGETITFTIPSGSARFATGGNITLANYASPLILNAGDTATFIVNDVGAGIGVFHLVGHTTFSASGTAVMTTGLINAGACGTTVTVPTTGVATTDSIAWAFNAAPLVNPAELVVSAWPTANNVNFQYCNPSAGGITPSAATLNWHVAR